MKVNIVTEKEGWILHRWAKEIQSRLSKHFDTFITVREVKGADVHIYCDYSFYKGACGGYEIGIFTHKEKEHEWLIEMWEKGDKVFDYKFAQSNVSLSQLTGDNKERLKIGVGDQFRKPLTIGISGREYEYTKRKRFHWIEKLRKEFPDIKFIFSDGSVPYEEMPKWYDDLNYLLVTSDNEGGPLPLAECIAHGRTVIVPRGVGWSGEYSVLLYDDYEDLCRVIRGLQWNETWDEGAEQIIKVIKENVQVSTR